jgi:hypothetical protein
MNIWAGGVTAAITRGRGDASNSNGINNPFQFEKEATVLHVQWKMVGSVIYVGSVTNEGKCVYFHSPK